MIMLKGKKIAFISHLGFNLYNHRLSWMKELKNQGAEIYAIIPQSKLDLKIREQGITVINYKVSRKGMNPLKEISTILQLRKILATNKFDIINTLTSKPNIYTNLALRTIRRKVKTINHITGLGYLFSSDKIFLIPIRMLVLSLYKLSLTTSDIITFQNKDDLSKLKDLISLRKVRMIKGSGINTKEFSKKILNKTNMRSELGLKNGNIIVTQVSRLLKTKGILVLIKASKLLAKENIIFLIAGDIDSGNPLSVDKNFIKDNSSNKTIFLGNINKVKELLSITDIFVLPSTHREGMPRAVLEAMSMSLPIITTNVPGCKDTVENNKNGIIIQPDSAVELAQAIEKLAKNPELRKEMSINSRTKAEGEFSERKILKDVLNMHKKILNNKR